MSNSWMIPHSSAALSGNSCATWQCPRGPRSSSMPTPHLSFQGSNLRRKALSSSWLGHKACSFFRLSSCNENSAAFFSCNPCQSHAVDYCDTAVLCKDTLQITVARMGVVLDRFGERFLSLIQLVIGLLEIRRQLVNRIVLRTRPFQNPQDNTCNCRTCISMPMLPVINHERKARMTQWLRDNGEGLEQFAYLDGDLAIELFLSLAQGADSVIA